MLVDEGGKLVVCFDTTLLEYIRQTPSRTRTVCPLHDPLWPRRATLTSVSTSLHQAGTQASLLNTLYVPILHRFASISLSHPHPQAIGLLASLLVAYEDAAPPSHLTRTSLAYTYAQCLAAHAPLLPAALRADIRAARTSDAALRRVEAALFAGDAALVARERTTQATDIVWGGVKSNALPEGAGAVVNHRIAVDR